MKQHPSLESLTAFFDRELSPAERPSIEQHVDGCSECSSLLEAFSTMGELGPMVEESLPGPAYWEDLPDRVWLRIEAENATPLRLGEPWWRRVFPRQTAWRWGFGSLAAAAAVAVVLIFRLPGDQGLSTTPFVTAGPQAPDPQSITSLLDRLSPHDAKVEPDLTPDTYAQRVITTLSPDGRDTGTSLDMPPGGVVVDDGITSDLGTQVSFPLSGPDVPAQGEAAATATGRCGDRTSVRKALDIAVEAEQRGRPDLAAYGYALVRANVPPEDPLFAEAHYRLNRLAWYYRMQQVAGIERARIMANLEKQASQQYQNWVKSRGDLDCKEAWCLNRVLVNLSGDVQPSVQVAQMQDRVNNLEDCLKP